jgi:lysozyme
VKPVLYVNQMFVNNYLTDQEDLKRDYRVWIARYSEYKPDVRLTYWQLCPDGRVAGIQGDVDINVFNGYQSQFDEFIANETIK